MEKVKEVKVDIDYKPVDVGELAWRWAFIEELFDVELNILHVAETNKGYHLHGYVAGDMDDKDIIIIQLALGSDYKRELYNLRRVKNGVDRWNVLFRAKYRIEDGEIVKVSEEKDRVDLAVRLWFKYWAIRAKGCVRAFLQKMKEVFGIVAKS